MPETAEELLEATANMLRGMTLDPRIPEDTKDVMRNRYMLIEQWLEGFADYDPYEGFEDEGAEDNG